MKHAFSALLVLLMSALCAQVPEQIHPFARGHRPVSYYREQSELWKKETVKDRTNVNAWYNYYYANRNIGFSDTTLTVSQKEEIIANIIRQMEAAIPESYEYNICKWLAGGWDMRLLPYLEKAQKLGPDRPEHLDFSIVLAEMNGDINARDKWSKRKYNEGMFSNGLLYYNYNVLTGLPKNALLITSGDNDTFPIWYLQALGVRPDVKVIHAYLVNLPEYRKPVFAAAGVSEPKSKDKIRRDELVEMIAANNSGRPVAVGLTANNCARSANTANLYLTGLAYLYSKAPLDNLAIMKRNFEQSYALDYLDKQLFPDISPDLVRTVNTNYVVPMLKLHEHYSLSGDARRADWMREKLIAIVAGTEYEKDVKKQLARN